MNRPIVVYLSISEQVTADIIRGTIPGTMATAPGITAVGTVPGIMAGTIPGIMVAGIALGIMVDTTVVIMADTTVAIMVAGMAEVIITTIIMPEITTATVEIQDRLTMAGLRPETEIRLIQEIVQEAHLQEIAAI